MILLGFVWSQTAKAQDFVGYSQITFDETTNTVYGYSASVLDYAGSWHYTAYVEGYLYGQTGSLLDSGYDEDYFLADVLTLTAGVPASEYTVLSDHYLVARFYTTVEIHECDPYCDFCYNYFLEEDCDRYRTGCPYDCYGDYWYDPWGFSFYGGGYYGAWSEFYGSGPPANLETQRIYLGSTSDSLVTPPDFCRLYPDSDANSDSTTYSPEATSCAARPYISGQHELWYFDGVTNVSKYATRITLTAHPAGHSDYQWEIVAGGDKAQFQGNFVFVDTGNTDHVDLISVSPSDSSKDVSIVLTVGGVSSARFKVTVSAPMSLKWLGTTNNPYPNGYETLVSYEIDKFDGQKLPSDVPVNERFPETHHDYIFNNWPYGCPGGATAPGAEFNDVISIGGSLELTPASCNPGVCPTVSVDWIGQDWRVGSAQTGLAVQDKFPTTNCPFNTSLGRLVQHNILIRYTDRAAHAQ